MALFQNAENVISYFHESKFLHMEKLNIWYSKVLWLIHFKVTTYAMEFYIPEKRVDSNSNQTSSSIFVKV